MADPKSPPAPPPVEPYHDELKRLYAYWLAKKGTRAAPARADIDPLEIAPLLPHVTLIDVESAPLRFRYRLVGTEIVNNVGEDFTGRYLDTLLRLAQRDLMAAELARVVASGQPAVNLWEYARHDGRHVRYERLVLPLSSDGKTVDMLLSGMVFDKAFG
ncbi:MAG: PAS domain-containing protein [Candidatus Eiseniibacteriota bacterium]